MPVDKIVETVYNGVHNPGLSTVETILKSWRILVDKAESACYHVSIIIWKEEVNMLKTGLNVFGRRLAPGVTVR